MQTIPFPSPGPCLRVLYIDSNEDDLLLTELASVNLHAPLQFRLLRSVAEALVVLDGIARGTEATPQVVLLDVLMESGHGWRVLEYVRRHPALAALPVVVYTAAWDPKVRLRAEQSGAAALIAKSNYRQAVVELLASTPGRQGEVL